MNLKIWPISIKIQEKLMKAIIGYPLLPQFHFLVVTTITYQWFTLSVSFFFPSPKNSHEYFISWDLPTLSIFIFSPNARGIAYQNSFTKPLSNVNSETPSDGTWLVSQEGTTMIWAVIRENVIFSQFHILLLTFFIFFYPPGILLTYTLKIFHFLRYISILLFSFLFISIVFSFILLVL